MTTLQVEEDRTSPRSRLLALRTPDEVAPKLEELRRAYVEASHYPRFRDLARYRVRVSAFIVLMIVTQEAAFVLPTVVKRRYILFRALSTLGWAIP